MGDLFGCSVVYGVSFDKAFGEYIATFRLFDDNSYWAIQHFHADHHLVFLFGYQQLIFWYIHAIIIKEHPRMLAFLLIIRKQPLN